MKKTIIFAVLALVTAFSSANAYQNITPADAYSMLGPVKRSCWMSGLRKNGPGSVTPVLTSSVKERKLLTMYSTSPMKLKNPAGVMNLFPTLCSWSMLPS